MQRLEQRTEAVFSLYPDQDEGDIIERRHMAELPAEVQAHRILVKCLELSLALQDIEPVQTTTSFHRIWGLKTKM